MTDLPQWPFIPAIQGQVPLPQPDPRSAHAKSLDFAKALMASKAQPPSVPLPTSDPRDWATRAITPQARSEDTTAGAIHPDALMKARGYEPTHGIDQFYGQPAINRIQRNNETGPQRPMGEPDPGWQQDVSNGLFGVPAQHLQQMAATKQPPVDQNLPKIPTTGFSPTLSPLYMNDTHPLSRPPAPNTPPLYWQPG